MPTDFGLGSIDLSEHVRPALREDVGHGDITTIATVPVETRARGTIVARVPGVLAGMPLALEVFRTLSPGLEQVHHLDDGARFATGEQLARLEGSARVLLTGERVALNYLQHLSAIATRVSEMVSMIADLPVRIVDTRKTIPGMRVLAKYAVRVGGGRNHRFGLFDGVLIKDNHIAAAGGITPALERARALAPHTLRVEIEVETLEEVGHALAAGADLLLLDNMDLQTLQEAVRQCKGRALTEASGGITESTLRSVAEAGVDFISIGALTHSVKALDLSLDLEVDD